MRSDGDNGLPESDELRFIGVVGGVIVKGDDVKGRAPGKGKSKILKSVTLFLESHPKKEL